MLCLDKGACRFRIHLDQADGCRPRQWSDFQEYSEADQAYFDQLLPLEGLDPHDIQADREIVPYVAAEMEVRAQSDVQLEEIHLLQQDEAAAIRLLQERGIIAGEFDPARQALQPVPTTRVAERQAKRASLDMRVRTEAAKILNQRGISPAGRALDRQRLGRDNLIVLKSAIDRRVNAAVGRAAGERHEFSRAELDLIDSTFTSIVTAAVQDVFDGN